MHDDVVSGVLLLCFGAVFFGAGILFRIPPHIIASTPMFLGGFYFLYKGIPLELRERRYRARRKRWEKLDEELEERDSKKRE